MASTLGSSAALLNELDHRIERIERMVQQNVALGDRREQIVAAARSPGGCRGVNGGSRRSLPADAVDQLASAPSGRAARRCGRPRVVRCRRRPRSRLELLLARRACRAVSLAPDRLDFQPHRLAALPLPRSCDSITRSMSSDSWSKQVESMSRVMRNVPVLSDLEAAEQLGQPCGDDLFEQDELVLSPGPTGTNRGNTCGNCTTANSAVRAQAAFALQHAPPGTAPDCETAGWDGWGRSPSA